MIRPATLSLLALSLIACSSDNIETAKTALIDSSAIKTEVSFSEVTNYPGDVVCGAFSAYISYHDPRMEDAPFIYRNGQIDRQPLSADWNVFCSETPANALKDVTGVGPITRESTQWLQIIDDFTALELSLESYY